MNYLDLILFAILAIFGLLGYRRGFIREVADLLILLVSFGIALIFFTGFSQVLGSLVSLPETFVRAGGFFTIWFVVELVMYSFTLIVLRRLPEEIKAARWNHFAGIILSVIKSAFMIGFVLITLLILPLGKAIENDIKSSFTGKLVDKNTDAILEVFKSTFGEAAGVLSKFATVTSGSKDKIDLGYKLANPVSDNTSAATMLVLVNSERKQVGLAELVLDEKLTEVAKAHAKDMFAQGYLSHFNLEGKSAFDRMNDADISPFFAGENLALAANVEAAMEGLLSSAGHKANLLSGDFGKIGIAVYDGGIHGKIFVQEFTD